MKGVIFNHFEEFLAEVLGEDRFEELYDEIVDELETREPFVGPGTYPDADFFRIFEHFLPHTGLSAAAAQDAFGHWVFPRLAAVFPVYVSEHNHAREFLKTVDGVIHVEVRKLFADTELPSFECEDVDDRTMDMTYVSSRGMNSFLEGLLRACGEHFGTPVSYELLEQGERGGKALFRYRLVFES